MSAKVILLQRLQIYLKKALQQSKAKNTTANRKTQQQTEEHHSKPNNTAANQKRHNKPMPPAITNRQTPQQTDDTTETLKCHSKQKSTTAINGKRHSYKKNATKRYIHEKHNIPDESRNTVLPLGPLR